MAANTNQWIASGLAAGFKANGIHFDAKNVDVTNKGPNKMFMVRLGKTKTALPSLGFIQSQIELDRVPPGSVQGAYYVLIGLVQQFGGTARITARILRVETGVVLHAAKADATADKAGFGVAFTQVVRDLWKTFRRAA
jgi:hypothetical protein